VPRTPPEFLDPARYPLHFEILPRYGDQDPNRHINNVAIAEYFQEGRNRFYRPVRAASDLLGLRGMMVGITIDYIAQAYHPDPVQLAVGIAKVGRSSWTFAELALQGGRPVAFALATDVSSDGHRSLLLSDGARAELKKYWISGLPQQ